MKKLINRKSLNAFILLIASIVMLASCKKKDSTVAEVQSNNPKTGNFSLQLGTNQLQGNIYGEGIYSLNHEFTGKPTLEVHLAGNNGQIDMLILNPAINTDIKCGISNSSNFFKVSEYVGNSSKSFASGDQGNVTVRLSKLDDISVVGTVTGVVKNIDIPATTDAVITNGTFTVNF